MRDQFVVLAAILFCFAVLPSWAGCPQGHVEDDRTGECTKSSMSSGTKQFKNVEVDPWDESKGLDRQSGFVSLVDGQLKFQQGLEIKSPQNTILIIYNHGGFGWKNRRSKCSYWGEQSILADLSGHIINGKTTMSWINCELWKAKGDDGYGCAWKNGGRA